VVETGAVGAGGDLSADDRLKRGRRRHRRLAAASLPCCEFVGAPRRLWRWGNCLEGLEGDPERLAPRPSAREVQAQAAGVAGEPACDVEEPVAQQLRLAAGELAEEPAGRAVVGAGGGGENEPLS